MKRVKQNKSYPEETAGENTTKVNVMKKICLKCLIGLLGVLALVQGAQAGVIIAFGDSITYGSGSSSGGYPPKLAALTGDDVRNYGVKSETTASGAARIDSPLAGHPDASFILIMEGTNDVYHGISLGSTQHNLEAMVDKSRAYGITPILATLTPDTREGHLYKDIQGAYNPMIQSVGSSKGVGVVDMYSAVAGNWDNLNYDGIHPNDSGYQVVANMWAGAVSSGGGGGGSSDGGGGGGCFIATAAFGSPLEKHVQLLTLFRDQYLLTNGPGTAFVDFYYAYSPPMADFIAQHDGLRSVVRFALYPLIGFSYIVVKGSLLHKAAALLTTIGVLGLLVQLRRRRKRLLCA